MLVSTKMPQSLSSLSFPLSRAEPRNTSPATSGSITKVSHEDEEGNGKAEAPRATTYTRDLLQTRGFATWVLVHHDTTVIRAKAPGWMENMKSISCNAKLGWSNGFPNSLTQTLLRFLPWRGPIWPTPRGVVLAECSPNHRWHYSILMGTVKTIQKARNFKVKACVFFLCPSKM